MVTNKPAESWLENRRVTIFENDEDVQISFKIASVLICFFVRQGIDPNRFP